MFTAFPQGDDFPHVTCSMAMSDKIYYVNSQTIFAIHSKIARRFIPLFLFLTPDASKPQDSLESLDCWRRRSAINSSSAEIIWAGSGGCSDSVLNRKEILNRLSG